jgi:hypothetical protein
MGRVQNIVRGDICAKEVFQPVSQWIVYGTIGASHVTTLKAKICL